MLEFYSKQYGTPLFGTRLVVAQVDDESLDTYSGPGIMFLASRLFDSSRSLPEEKLQREVAYQWWGQTVGLKSFDDAWISQGLAEWSSFAFRESTLSGGALEAAQREQQERALTFEQTASIARAPSALDDQSAAYQRSFFTKAQWFFACCARSWVRKNSMCCCITFSNRIAARMLPLTTLNTYHANCLAKHALFLCSMVEGTGVPEFTVDYQIIRTRAGKFRTRGTVKQTLESLRMPVQLMLRSEGDTQTILTTIEGRSEDFDFESNGQPIEVVVDPNYKILRMSDDLRDLHYCAPRHRADEGGQYAEAQHI